MKPRRSWVSTDVASQERGGIRVQGAVLGSNSKFLAHPIGAGVECRPEGPTFPWGLRHFEARQTRLY